MKKLVFVIFVTLISITKVSPASNVTVRALSYGTGSALTGAAWLFALKTEDKQDLSVMQIVKALAKNPIQTFKRFPKTCAALLLTAGLSTTAIIDAGYSVYKRSKPEIISKGTHKDSPQLTPKQKPVVYVYMRNEIGQNEKRTGAYIEQQFAGKVEFKPYNKEEVQVLPQEDVRILHIEFAGIPRCYDLPEELQSYNVARIASRWGMSGKNIAPMGDVENCAMSAEIITHENKILDQDKKTIEGIQKLRDHWLSQE